MEPITLIALVAPIVKQMVTGLIQKYIPSKSPEDARLDRAQDVEVLKILNPTPGESYPWVSAILLLQRPVIAVGTIGLWGFQEATLATGATPAVVNAACVVGFYLFGERLFFSSKS